MKCLNFMCDICIYLIKINFCNNLYYAKSFIEKIEIRISCKCQHEKCSCNLFFPLFIATVSLSMSPCEMFPLHHKSSSNTSYSGSFNNIVFFYRDFIPLHSHSPAFSFFTAATVTQLCICLRVHAKLRLCVSCAYGSLDMYIKKTYEINARWCCRLFLFH